MGERGILMRITNLCCIFAIAKNENEKRNFTSKSWLSR